MFVFAVTIMLPRFRDGICRANVPTTRVFTPCAVFDVQFVAPKTVAGWRYDGQATTILRSPDATCWDCATTTLL